MSGGRTFTRRQFVLGAGSAAAAAVAAVVVINQVVGDSDSSTNADGPTSTPPTQTPPTGTPATLPEVSPLEGVRAVGEVYRSEYPEDTSVETLQAALPTFVGLSGEDAVALLPTLTPAITEDFASGQVVSVDGWVLSLTEAQAAGLISTLP